MGLFGEKDAIVGAALEQAMLLTKIRKQTEQQYMEVQWEHVLGRERNGQWKIQ